MHYKLNLYQRELMRKYERIRYYYPLVCELYIVIALIKRGENISKSADNVIRHFDSMLNAHIFWRISLGLIMG